jgi:transcriptional regulator with XRE-family HTH domain
MMVEIDHDKLRRARAEAHMSQMALAVAARLNIATIRVLDTGRQTRARVGNARRIAAALGCTVESLAPDPPAEPAPHP